MIKAPRLTRLVLVLAVVPCALLLAGCGESEQEKFEKAKAEVCKSRSAIEKQVDGLKSLPISPRSIESRQEERRSDREGTEEDQRRGAEARARNQEAGRIGDERIQSHDQLADATIGSGTFNPSTATKQAEAALKKLLTSYEATLQKLSCS